MDNSRGFTLIELMIVIAIIAILATIGVVQYLDYTVRAKVSESLNLAGTAKLAVVEVLAATGQFPDNNFDAALPAANTINGQYVQSVTVGDNGQITVLLAATGLDGNPGMNGRFLTLTPIDNQGSVDWQCAIGADITRYKYVPARCRN